MFHEFPMFIQQKLFKQGVVAWFGLVDGET
jgi:hypothetical protein